MGIQPRKGSGRHITAASERLRTGYAQEPQQHAHNPGMRIQSRGAFTIHPLAVKKVNQYAPVTASPRVTAPAIPPPEWR